MLLSLGLLLHSAAQGAAAAHCDGVVAVGPGFNGRTQVTNSLDGSSGFTTLNVARLFHHPTYVQPNDEVFDIAAIDVLT